MMKELLVVEQLSAELDEKVLLDLQYHSIFIYARMLLFVSEVAVVLNQLRSLSRSNKGKLSFSDL
jgi:hypothetical protein